MTDRYAPLRQVARDLDVEAVALVPGATFTRVMGQSFGTNERPLVVIVPVDGAPAAIVPQLELQSWALTGFEGEVFDWRDQTGYTGAFEALARAMPLRSLAVEGQVMRVFVHHALARAHPGLRLVDAETQIAGLRLHKTEEEVAALLRANEISEAALGEVLDGVRIGQTEAEIRARLIAALFAHGAEGNAFGPIVLAADNSARAHGHARADYALQDGDALLVDFGAVWGGLNADITRTFFVGHATDEAREVYDLVRRANAVGHEVTKAGATAHDVDDAVMQVLEASPYADHIGSKTGHGLGRDVHEAPYIMRGNHQVLEPGMVFTNEPSLLIAGRFGVRIEDDLLVTEGGNRSLTSFPRDLRVVG
ncbi:M24 family metallopeptidase [Wenxinia saemankumensis]|uniref:Xaa-Pro aminopeptidase n=1 Tax=Wenxinia saemankumensis TaxID=1447782 RepID=A0A1M6CYC0_9RHOB|nr:Xaa-Pro peptidase family protein [Wenxinia saemankumensis]SHI65718.1 Xaa-Pro aminopeptidase [Wenxinia saemankumensis]